MAGLVRGQEWVIRTESILERAARHYELSLASVQVHYFSAMKSSLFETANGATQQVFLIDAK